MLLLFYPSATSRKGHDIETMTDVESPAQCAAMCNQHQRCLAWSYEKNNCSLKETMPLHAYSPDVTSGKSEMLVCLLFVSPHVKGIRIPESG